MATEPVRWIGSAPVGVVLLRRGAHAFAAAPAVGRLAVSIGCEFLLTPVQIGSLRNARTALEASARERAVAESTPDGLRPTSPRPRIGATVITRTPRNGKIVDVTFAVDHARHNGDGVSVVGEFNDWDPAANPLDGSGDLATTLSLKSGQRYRFRYLTDAGEWFNDEGADGYVPNEFGGADGVLDLAEVPALTGADH